MVKIILIGRCCRVSFDMIDLNLKGKTSLFEWTWCDTMTDVNFIIQKIINNEPIKIQRIGGDDYMEGTSIKTSHYLTKNYAEIVSRRASRFMNDIKTNKEILFIRDDCMNTITSEEIQKFYSLINNINPLLSFKMLLLSKESEFKPIHFPNLHHKIYAKSKYKTYIMECYEIDNNCNTNTRDISDDES